MAETSIDLLMRCGVLTKAVAEHIKDSVLYLDAGAGEAAFATHGLKLLQGGKAVMLAQLEQASWKDVKAASFLHGQVVTKMVIIVHQLLTSAFSSIVAALQVHTKIQECTILSSLCETAHAIETDLSEHAYVQFATAVQQAVVQHAPQSAEKGAAQQQARTVSIHVQHFPLHICPLTSTTFVLPAVSPRPCASYQEKLAGYAPGNRRTQGPVPTDAHEPDDEEEGQAGLRLLAHSLVEFAAQQDLRLDPFALGPASRVLGDIVCALPAPHMSGGLQPSTVASLLLVDRQMDLLTPSLHHEHVLDRIFGQLQPRHDAARLHHNPHIHNQSKIAPLDPAWRPRGFPPAPRAAHQSIPDPPVNPAEADATQSPEAPSNPAPHASSIGNAHQPADDANASLSAAQQMQASGHVQEEAVLQQPKQQHHLRSLDVLVPLGSPNQQESPCMGSLQGSVLGSGQARDWLHFLMGRQPKDALLYLRKWLREAARKEDVQLKAGRSKLTDQAVVAQEILAWTAAITAKPAAMLRQRAMLQLACAAAHALQGAGSANWDGVHRREQQLLAAAESGTETLCNALMDIWRAQVGDQSAEGLELHQCMLLTRIAYWLAAGQGPTDQQDIHSNTYSPFHPDQEAAVQGAVVKALLKTDVQQLQQLPWLQDLAGMVQQDQTSQHQMHTFKEDEDTVEQDEHDQDILQQSQDSPHLTHVSEQHLPADMSDPGSALYYQRQQLKLELHYAVEQQLAQIRSSAALQACVQLHMKPATAGDPSVMSERPERQPLLASLTRAILQHQDVHGLYHASASLSGLLKSGLGRMGLLQKRPHPADHRVVIMFVVGGISMAEMRSVQKAASEHEAAAGLMQQLLIGGTMLTRANDVPHNSF